jgi:hypothetical protein
MISPQYELAVSSVVDPLQIAQPIQRPRKENPPSKSGGSRDHAFSLSDAGRCRRANQNLGPPWRAPESDWIALASSVPL